MDENTKTENNNTATTDLWLPLLLLMLNNNNQPNVMLEKEVSYLQGKVDTLEKILLRR